MAGDKDSSYQGGEHADASVEIVTELLSKASLTNAEILTGIFPDDSAQSVSDHIFKLCHIDVDVHDSARSVTEWVWPRLSIGGVVVYDDYGFKGTDGVTTFVESQRGLKGRLVIHNLNGHAVIVKTG